MSCAVEFESHVVRIVTATVVGERDVGGTEIGSVEDDYFVVFHYLHVHG